MKYLKYRTQYWAYKLTTWRFENIHNFAKMKLFQITQKNLAILGIDRNQSTQKHPFNGRILLGFFLFGLFIILTSTFFFHEASSFREYTETIYTLSGTIACTVAFTSTIFKMKMLFNFIAMSENIVDISK